MVATEAERAGAGHAGDVGGGGKVSRKGLGLELLSSHVHELGDTEDGFSSEEHVLAVVGLDLLEVLSEDSGALGELVEDRKAAAHGEGKTQTQTQTQPDPCPYPYVVGLTGGIASGKSTAAKTLVQLSLAPSAAAEATHAAGQQTTRQLAACLPTFYRLTFKPLGAAATAIWESRPPAVFRPTQSYVEWGSIARK